MQQTATTKNTPDSPLLIVADQVVVNSITTSTPSPPTVVPAPSATETTFVKHSTPLVIAETDAATTKTEPVKVTSSIIPEPVVPLCAAKEIVAGFPTPTDVPIQSAATSAEGSLEDAELLLYARTERPRTVPTSTSTTFVEASIEDAELLLFVRTEVQLNSPKTKSQTVARHSVAPVVVAPPSSAIGSAKTVTIPEPSGPERVTFVRKPKTTRRPQPQNNADSEMYPVLTRPAPPPEPTATPSASYSWVEAMRLQIIQDAAKAAERRLSKSVKR
ncbi:hypothetical protein HDU99_000137 [Rhizoclosmatium hyalinum]|nr:hypothetical protein HDU99_000137 [Rhizoclosmatium hyalinum]